MTIKSSRKSIVIILICVCVFILFIFSSVLQTKTQDKGLAPDISAPTTPLANSPPTTPQPSQKEPPPSLPLETRGKVSTTSAEKYQTFLRPRVGISFSLPRTYTILEETDSYIQIMSPLSPVFHPNISRDELKIEMRLTLRKTDDSLAILIRENAKTEDDSKIEEIRYLSVSGFPAARWAWKGTMGSGETVVFVTNTHRIIVQKYPYSSRKNSDFEYFLQSLNSFQPSL